MQKGSSGIRPGVSVPDISSRNQTSTSQSQAGSSKTRSSLQPTGGLAPRPSQTMPSESQRFVRRGSAESLEAQRAKLEESRRVRNELIRSRKKDFATLTHWVDVPQKQAALIGAHDPAAKFIATDGLGTCVGVLVVGAEKVGLAHLDSDSVDNAKTLANYAKGTIEEVRNVYVVNPTANKPTGTTQTLIEKVKEVFPEAAMVEASQVAYDMAAGKVHTDFRTRPDNSGKVDEGIPRWHLAAEGPDKFTGNSFQNERLHGDAVPALLSGVQDGRPDRAHTAMDETAQVVVGR